MVVSDLVGVPGVGADPAGAWGRMFPGGVGVCRSMYALCGLLCGSVAAFYGVGVLCIGLWNKIALWGVYSVL